MERFEQAALSDSDEAINVLWSNLEPVLDIAVNLFKRRTVTAQTRQDIIGPIFKPHQCLLAVTCKRMLQYVSACQVQIRLSILTMKPRGTSVAPYKFFSRKYFMRKYMVKPIIKLG